jgi:hypothetical protein
MFPNPSSVLLETMKKAQHLRAQSTRLFRLS